MWWPIVICALAVVMIAGPIMLMQPTPAQRRLKRLRDAAMTQGMRVRLQPIPGETAKAGSMQPAAYCLPWPEDCRMQAEWILRKRAFSHEMHAFNHWEWLKEPVNDPIDVVAPWLDKAPEFCQALSCSPDGLCAYWQEFGEVANVEALAGWLTSVSGVLATQFKRSL